MVDWERDLAKKIGLKNCTTKGKKHVRKKIASEIHKPHEVHYS